MTIVRPGDPAYRWTFQQDVTSGVVFVAAPAINDVTTGDVHMFARADLEPGAGDLIRSQGVDLGVPHDEGGNAFGAPTTLLLSADLDVSGSFFWFGMLESVRLAAWVNLFLEDLDAPTAVAGDESRLFQPIDAWVLDDFRDGPFNFPNLRLNMFAPCEPHHRLRAWVDVNISLRSVGPGIGDSDAMADITAQIHWISATFGRI